MSYELRVTCHRVPSYELRVPSSELRVTSYELRVTCYELRVTSYELRVTCPTPSTLHPAPCTQQHPPGPRRTARRGPWARTPLAEGTQPQIAAEPPPFCGHQSTVFGPLGNRTLPHTFHLSPGHSCLVPLHGPVSPSMDKWSPSMVQCTVEEG
jgi:hypothetical protein